MEVGEIAAEDRVDSDVGSDDVPCAEEGHSIEDADGDPYGEQWMAWGACVPPAARRRVEVAGMFVLGGGLLTPFNAVLSAMDAFEAANSSAAVRVASLLPPLMTAATASVYFLMLRFGMAVPVGVRLVAGFAAFSVLLIALSFAQSYAAVVVLGVACGATLGVVEATLFDLGACLPPQCAQAAFGGMALSFLLNLWRLATKLAAPQDALVGILWSARLFFWSLVPVTAACALISFVLFWRRRYPRLPPTLASCMAAFAAIRYDALLIFLVYASTLSVFPGMLSYIAYAPLGSWALVILIGLYNFGDFVGKMVPLLRYPHRLVDGVVVTRIALVPLFLVCYLLSGDWLVPFIVTAVADVVFGASNGWATVQLFERSTAPLPLSLKPYGGVIMMLLLECGLVVGGTIGVVLVALRPRQ